MKKLRRICATPLRKLSRERPAEDDKTRFLRSTKIHRATSIKEAMVQLKVARKKQPNKRSEKNVDGLYEVLAPVSVVQKAYHNASVIREPGKLEVTVRNSDIAKFGNRDEKKTKLTENIN